MKKFFAVAAALFLVACNEAPSGQNLAPVRFTNQPPIRVNVAQIRVENQTPTKPNAVDAQMPTAPEAAIQQWGQDRLVAGSGSGTLVVNIEDASVVETKLPKTEGFKGFFTDDQDAKYDGKMVVTFRLYTGANTMADAEASVNVSRGRSINEKATVAQRELFFHQLVTDMMVMFNSEADARIRQFLGNYTSY